MNRTPYGHRPLPNSCFTVIDAATGKPSLFYDTDRARQEMRREAKMRQQQFARRSIKLKEP